MSKLNNVVLCGDCPVRYHCIYKSKTTCPLRKIVEK